MIICISGLAGSGKTTLADYLQKELAKRDIQPLRYTSDYLGEKLFAETFAKTLGNPDFDYSKEELGTIYKALFLLCDEIYSANPNSVIITDGMYRKASQRLILRTIAEKHEVPFLLIKMQVDSNLAKKRLQKRSQLGQIGGWVDPKEYEEPCDSDLITIDNTGAVKSTLKSANTIVSKIADSVSLVSSQIMC